MSKGYSLTINGQRCACLDSKSGVASGKGDGVIMPAQATITGMEYNCAMVESYLNFWEETPGVFAEMQTQRGLQIRRSDLRIEAVVQSKGSHDRSAYLCGSNYLPINMSRISKCFKPCVLMIEHEICPKNFLDTELDDAVLGNIEGDEQDQIAWANSLRIQDAYNRAIARDFGKTAYLGIHKGTDSQSAHFDGIIAQSFYSADASKIYYHTTKNTLLDVASVEDGTNCIYVKVGGTVVKFSVTPDAQTPIQDIELVPDAQYTFETYDELTAAIQTLISSVCSVYDNDGEGTLYDAYFVGNTLTVVSRIAHYAIDLGLASVPCGYEVDFTCDLSDNLNNHSVGEGWTTECLQEWMNTADYAILGTSTKITKDNAGYELQDAYCDFVENVHHTFLLDEFGSEREIYMVVDPVILRRYNQFKNSFALGNNGAVFNPTDSATDSNVVSSSYLRNTGIILITVEENFVPFMATDSDSMFKLGFDEKCDEIWAKYRTYAGIEIRCFGAIWLNLCGSRFAEKLKGRTPMKYEFNDQFFDGTRSLPCWSELCQDRAISRTCNVSGQTEVVVSETTEEGVTTFNVSAMLPSHATTEVPEYLITVTLDDGTVLTFDGNEAEFSIADFSGNFLVEVEVSAGSCGTDTVAQIYSYSGEIKAFVCPDSFDFTIVQGSAETADYPNPESTYIHSLSETGFATFTSGTQTANYLGGGVWEFTTAVSEITGVLEIAGCDSLTQTNTL